MPSVSAATLLSRTGCAVGVGTAVGTGVWTGSTTGTENERVDGALRLPAASTALTARM